MDPDQSLSYWPDRWPVKALMGVRAEVGAAAFDSEYQGVPNLGGLTEWPAEWWDDRPGKPFWFDQWPDQLAVKVIGLDPSKGGPNSDYQALASVALHRDGTLYVDCHLDREPVHRMVQRAVRTAREWGPHSVVVEENATLGLLRVEFEDQMRAGGVLPVEYLTNTDDKHVRILAEIGPYLARGQVRVRRSRGGQMLADQGRQFPHSDTDDGLDAVSMAVRRISRFYGR
jgi:predicted phage terminase large subunit-like protein